MVQLKKLKLSTLENDIISDQNMRCLKGGNACSCSCLYADLGGSSSGWNDATNFSGGYTSVGGGSEACGCAGASGASTSDFWKGHM